MTAPDAQPPAAWWNPSTANTSTTPTIVRWFDAAGREIPAPKDGYTDDQFRRASAAVARCFAADAEVAPTRSREFYNEIAHEVLVAVGAVSAASAALAGTTTPTDERADLLERLNQVIDLSRRLDADDLDPSVEPITDPERDVWGAAALLHSALHRYGTAVRDEYWALLAPTPTTEETDR